MNVRSKKTFVRRSELFLSSVMPCHPANMPAQYARYSAGNSTYVKHENEGMRSAGLSTEF